MPRISVVVPIYNVERYLEPCLESIARQTVTDLEVIMVDDGSTDGSRAIAERFAERDPRFRLVTQPNGGLGKARNTGADAASGEYLAFVDSDDVLPLHAYELLLGALEKSGSDFATGNVHRFTSAGTKPAWFLARAFSQDRLKTHVTRFRPLLEDRIVPNKLWRRSFWDEHGLRFPVGVTHEDIPVVLPAQFMARSVDVISEPVYYYRLREGGAARSITQRRAEVQVLLDRITAVEHVSEFLAREGPRRGKRWYDASVLAADLKYYLDVLDIADDEYRAVFLDRVNAFLDGVGRRAYSELPAIDRLKWELVRRRRMPEVLEVLRFQRTQLRDTPPVRVGRHWYGDYPFRTDPEMRIPRSVYRLDHSFRMHSRIETLRWNGSALEISGWALIGSLGAAGPRSQRVTLTALRQGRFERVRLRLPFAGVRFRVRPVHRPDVTSTARQRLVNLDWSGFAATITPRRMRRLLRWREGTLHLYLTVRAGGVRRRRARFVHDPLRPLRAVDVPVAGGVSVRAVPTRLGDLTIQIRRDWAAVRECAFEDGAWRLRGELGGTVPGRLQLRVVRPDRSARVDVDATIDTSSSPAGFEARVALSQLPADVEPIVEGHSGEREDGIHWNLVLVGEGTRRRVVLPDDVPERAWPTEGGEAGMIRTQQGDASLVVRTARPVVVSAEFEPDGTLMIHGESHLDARPHELLAVNSGDRSRHVFALDTGGGRFSARLPVTRMPTLAGVLPLRSGRWELRARPAGAEDESVPVMLSEALFDRLPISTVHEHKPLALGADDEGRARLAVEPGLDPAERGAYHQRLLRASAYTQRRAEPLRDAVVYASFRGRQYSDSPRAIHEELVRRGLQLEHLWVVRDSLFEVPDSTQALRHGSREYYEALATARYVVANDHFPSWLTRRPDQVFLQTWHGTPLKRLGLDRPDERMAMRRFNRDWEEQVANWQHVLSPNRFATPVLREAFGITGDILETGYPRNDVLADGARDAAAERVRRMLGVPAGSRVVLYAPTYRDNVTDARGRHRLDLRLDFRELSRALGPETVLLYRKHHWVVDALPPGLEDVVRDVSAYPDGTELLAATDVLITDYSAMMFDFANTGRPLLFYTYDLEEYENEVRGFYFDFAERAPGPLLRTTGEVAEALLGIEDVHARHASRYEQFAATFCELDDGRATARVADLVFQS